jgi:formylglycine-generating enzyme required for sulfatase activity
MKIVSLAVRIGLSVLTLVTGVAAKDAHFFRIVGPVPTTITALGADGYVTWTNVPTNATFTVQTATSLMSASNWVDYVRVPATNGVTTNRIYDLNPPSGMVLIPAGSFTMGGSGSDELPLHTVYVSAFAMDQYEVTKAQWDEVYNWATNHGYSFDYGARGKATNHPVHTVTWYDAVKWCNARSEKEGRVPEYYTSAAQTTVCRTGQTNVQNAWVKWSSGYRLPTEAEWEKAARGGASGQQFPWGNTISWSQANYYAFEGYHPTFAVGGQPYTSPVGYFAANGYGLYDMAGNIWEWCWDWYGSYSSGARIDPRGPGGFLEYRILRGGDWGHYAGITCCAYRGYYYPGVAINYIGFRCVRGF